jgi:hypothetical protein
MFVWNFAVSLTAKATGIAVRKSRKSRGFRTKTKGEIVLDRSEDAGILFFCRGRRNLLRFWRGVVLYPSNKRGGQEQPEEIPGCELWH